MTADEYLGNVERDGDATIAAAGVMDRLTERLKAADKGSERMREKRAAAEAVAELASDADDVLAVVEAAKNEAGSVAMEAQTGKDQILKAINSATEECRTQAAEGGLTLDHGYALDRYLEENLKSVKRIESTDHHAETTLSWQFDDDVAVEVDDGTHLEKYNFYKKLAMGTRKKLQPDLVSEEIGDPEENEDQYAKLSLGPRSRPWAEDNWIQCITDILDERQTFSSSVGARTMAWEDISKEIGLSRAASRIGVAVDQLMPFAKAAEGGDLDEIWLPGKMVTNICEDFSVEPKALQEELAARGVNSDELGGDKISERIVIDGSAVRFWRLDATHDEVPEPADIVDEIETGTDRLKSIEWGDLDE